MRREENPSSRSGGNSIYRCLQLGPVLAVIGMIEDLLRWARATAKVLALFVALTMALDLHPAHAQASGEDPAHSHFGATCDTPEFEKAPLGGSETTSSNYADCVHHCPALHRAATEHRTMHDSGAFAMANIESYRQTFSVFDPPPPRVPS